MRKTEYLSQRAWQSIDPDLRRAILRALQCKRADLVSKTLFIANIENKLRECGEHELANMLIANQTGI